MTDGVCETATGNGVCTLRAAVMEANHVPGGAATIVLGAQTYVLTVPTATPDTEASGDLDLTAPMTIRGAGASATIVDANDAYGVFDVADVAVVLRGFAARDGRLNAATGGCIANAGDLTLEDFAAVSCVAGLGGGIYNTGTLTLRESIVADSFATNLALPGSGGGVYNADGATLRSEDTLITNNGATSGGGLFNAGSATIERTTLYGNYAGSTAAPTGGGGIFNDGTLVVVNTTFSWNQGGAIFASDGSAELVSVTIADNYADIASQSGGEGGGITVALSGAVTLRNSIVSGNSRTGGTIPSECAGTIVSGDYNVIGKRNTCNLTGVTDHVNTIDQLGTIGVLFPHGGFGPDHFPSSGLLPVSACSDALGAPLLVDGRGYARGAGGNCSIGAVEAAGRYRPASPIGVELLRNGGAAGNERGIVSAETTIAEPPYWAQAALPGMDQVLYGTPDFPAQGGAPGGSGLMFFTGGASASSVASQGIDVSAAAAEIDGGDLSYRIAGTFGGYLTDDDHATLTVAFLDAGSVTISNATIGGFDAADRGNETKLLPDAVSGVVPVGTRFLAVQLVATRATGAYNDGYADKLSVVLPEPSASLLGGSAFAALACARSRRKRSLA